MPKLEESVMVRGVAKYRGVQDDRVGSGAGDIGRVGVGADVGPGDPGAACRHRRVGGGCDQVRRAGLIGADVDGGSGLSPAGPARAPRWSVVGMPARRCRRRSPGCRAVGPSSASARRIAQRGQTRVGHADDVAVDPVRQTTRAAGAHQIVRAGHGAGDVASRRLSGDDRVGQCGRAAAGVQAAAACWRSCR